MNLFNIWRNLTGSERSQVIVTLLIGMFFTLVILYGFLVSRGHDVDYFKERLSLMEHRLNYIEQKTDKINEKQGEMVKDLSELRRKEEMLQREMEDNRKWLEYWKSLPNLPRPLQKR